MSKMQRLRDNPDCADEEHKAKANENDPGLNVKQACARKIAVSDRQIGRAHV